MLHKKLQKWFSKSTFYHLRDLNIHNVALDEKGYAKIIDFDSSRIVSSLFPDLFKDHHGLADIMEDCAIGEVRVCYCLSIYFWILYVPLFILSVKLGWFVLCWIKYL